MVAYCIEDRRCDPKALEFGSPPCELQALHGLRPARLIFSVASTFRSIAGRSGAC